MPPTSISSSASSAAQYGLQQLKLQQALRNADRAEQAARSLEAAANSAKQDAQQAQDNARSLEIQSGTAQAAAGRARQGVAAIKTSDQMKASLNTTLDQTIQKLPENASATATTTTTGSESSVTTSSTGSSQQSSPVINTQGETTGTIINTTA